MRKIKLNLMKIGIEMVLNPRIMRFVTLKQYHLGISKFCVQKHVNQNT